MLEKIYSPEDKVIIIGGGVSFKEVNTSKIKDKHIIGVNAAYKLGSWIDILFFGDCRFYEWNRLELEKWSNSAVTCCTKLKNHPKIEYLEPIDSQHINIEDLNTISWPTKNGGANSGGAAICLAAKLGAKNIFLLGFDGQPVNGQHHWHNYYKMPSRDWVYSRFNNFFKVIAQDALECNINIYNVNPDSAIPYFKKITPDEFYEIIS